MRHNSKRLKFSYVITLVLTFFALFIFLISTPVLSAAGDMNIAEYLASSKISSGFFFISPALAGILRVFNRLYTANWWVIFSIFAMFGGLYVFLWFLNKRCAFQDWTALLFADSLFVLFFWELMLKYEINFTQTTSIVGLAAVLLMLDCCYDKSTDRKFMIVKICLGIGLLFLAGSIRFKALVLMVPFAMMCLIYFFLFPYTSPNLQRTLQNSWRTKKKFLLLAGMIITVVLMSYGLHKLYGVINPDLGEYVKANALREEICDYADRYPDYDQNVELYQELDIQKSWINMINAFLTGDENHFSSADLNKMARLRLNSHQTVESFTGSLRGHAVLWTSLGALLVFLMLLRGGKNSYLPLIGCIFAFLLCGLYFVAIGRIAWRVTNGCVLACVLSFIAMAAHPVSDVTDRRFDLTERTGILALTAGFFVVGCVAVRYEKDFSLPRAAVTDQERADMLDYINGNPDIIYLDVEDTIRYYNAYNLWASHEPEYLDNAVSLVAHFVIGERETLAESGIDDIINDMLERPDIYVRYCSSDSNGTFLNYLRDYYDECVSVSIVDRCDSTRFVRYSRPVSATGEMGGHTPAVNTFFEVRDEFPNDPDVVAAVQVDCHLDPADGGLYRDYYLNIMDQLTGALYSYGLKAEESGCSGEVLWMDGTWDTDNIQVSLVGHGLDGSCDTIADVTEEFSAICIGIFKEFSS